MIKRQHGTLVGVILIFLLGIPVLAEDNTPTGLTKLADGKARVIFLRLSSVFQSGKPAELQVNGTTVAKLRNREFTYFDLPAGEHYLVITAFPTTGAFRSGLHLKRNQPRFLLVRPNTRNKIHRELFGGSRRFGLNDGQFDVHEIGPLSGEDYRQSMRYRKPLAAVPPLKRG